MRISDWSSDVCSSDLAAMLKRFDDSSAMARMRPEIAENPRRRGGPASLLITSGPAGVENRTLEDVAQERGVAPVDAPITILRQRAAGVPSSNPNADDIPPYLTRPRVVTLVDAEGWEREWAAGDSAGVPACNKKKK